MMHSIRATAIVAAAVAGVVSLQAVAAQQPAATGGCISLKGSSACPSFQEAFINPTSLADDWSFFNNVTDVASFDARFAAYLVSDRGYYADQIANGLQCRTEAAHNVTLQWQQTIFCSRFAQQSFDAGCNGAGSEGQDPAPRPAPVCEETCVQFVASEHSVLDFDSYCPNDGALTAAQNTTRYDTLRTNFRTCTDRSLDATRNNATCVLGINNEGSCGFASSVDQLCAHCDPRYNDQLPSCCFDARTDLSTCAEWGHPRASSIVPQQSVATNIGASPMAIGATSTASTPAPDATMSAAGVDPSGNGNGGASAASPTATATGRGAGAGQANGDGNTVLVSASDNVLSDGQLAGAIVGCIVGALLLGALLALLLLRCCRKDRKDTEANATGAGAVYGNAANGSHVERPWMQSEDGMVKSPELGGAKDGKFGAGGAAGAALGAGALGAGAAAAGAAAGKGRDSVDDRPISAMSGETGTDGRGTTIPAVKDQYSSHDICTGETVVAIYPYNATLNDEISLQPDDVITVQRLYDDGWALGRTEAGTEGAFPLVCVTSTKGGTTSGGSGEGLGSSTGGVTSGNDGNVTSSVDGAVTADEGFTSDATGLQQRR
ncbi:uncharacterized protein PSFLO_03131 [Pseudozyma flocculosa]|uniref:SH3 domain-containing protein n=1 Tax=Pseudozyma flocculosa TaxID=84751 RepID=A0A5C3F0V4_9BASI|nr:uncharacterized protein PSFLO_03131 [Pseudozyma flocculosa]